MGTTELLPSIRKAREVTTLRDLSSFRVSVARTESGTVHGFDQMDGWRNQAIALTENCYSQRDCKKSGRELFWQNVHAWTAGRTSLPGVSGITLGDRLRLSGSCIVRPNRALVSRTKLFLSPLPDDSIRLRRSPKISARIFPSAAPYVSHDRSRFRSLGESSSRELSHP
jgi:hypothetical protein